MFFSFTFSLNHSNILDCTLAIYLTQISLSNYLFFHNLVLLMTQMTVKMNPIEKADLGNGMSNFFHNAHNVYNICNWNRINRKTC